MTTVILNLVVIVLVAVACARPLRRMAAGPILLAVLVLAVLTMVFDTAMIAADLYVFDADKITGLRVWGAPIEDFAYALVAGVAVPVLWTVLPSRRGSRRGAGEAAAAIETWDDEGGALG